MLKKFYETMYLCVIKYHFKKYWDTIVRNTELQYYITFLRNSGIRTNSLTDLIFSRMQLMVPNPNSNAQMKPTPSTPIVPPPSSTVRLFQYYLCNRPFRLWCFNGYFWTVTPCMVIFIPAHYALVCCHNHMRRFPCIKTINNTPWGWKSLFTS